MKLIDKDALVAEIYRLENKLYYEPEKFKDVGAKMALDSLKSSLDTLEVKYLQEEPVSKVWHDVSERPDYNVGKVVIVGYNDDDDLYDECDNVAYHITLSIFVSWKDLNTRVVRWAYLKDLI